jgi:dihydroxy-acid dehydratase
LLEAVKKNIKPLDIVTRKSIENAVALIMAIGGSTNTVLHYLAIAHAAGVDWTLDDFERVRRNVPVLCDLKPSGRHMAVDLHRAGGILQVLKLLLDAGLIYGDCPTITGRTLAEELAGVPDKPREDQDVIMPLDKALYREGYLALLKGNLAENGAVAKITGLKSPGHVTPEAFEGGTIALVEEGDIITIDAHKLLLQLHVDEVEIPRRRAAWKQPEPRYRRGVLSKLAALARPANEGAVTG